MRFEGRGAHRVAEVILRSIAEGTRGIISDRLDFGVNQESVSGVLSGKRQFPSAAVHSRRDDDLRRESVLKLEVGVSSLGTSLFPCLDRDHVTHLVAIASWET